MPKYEYTCLDCKNNFTIDATIKEKGEDSKSKFICPKCKSNNIRQDFSNFGGFIKNTNSSCPTGRCPFMK